MNKEQNKNEAKEYIKFYPQQGYNYLNIRV